MRHHLVVASVILAVGCGRGEPSTAAADVVVIAPTASEARERQLACIAPAIDARERCKAEEIKAATLICANKGGRGIAPDGRNVAPSEQAQCVNEWYYGTDEFPGWAQECTAEYLLAVAQCE